MSKFQLNEHNLAPLYNLTLSLKRFFAGFIICLVKCNSDINRLVFPNYIHLLLMIINYYYFLSNQQNDEDFAGGSCSCSGVELWICTEMQPLRSSVWNTLHSISRDMWLWKRCLYSGQIQLPSLHGLSEMRQYDRVSSPE